MKKGFAQFVIGIVIAVAGAGIMFHGSILGEYNSNIALVLGLIGILLIATSKYRLMKRKEAKLKKSKAKKTKSKKKSKK